jgi:DNA-directed RNA polymerase subunit RPC12/RpoP
MKEESFVKARREQTGTNEGGWKPGLGQLLGLFIAVLLLLGSVILGVTTSLGLIFAIPVAVLAVAIAFLVFKGGAAPRLIRAACPHCGATVRFPSHISETGCPSCGQQVVLRGGRLDRAA